MAVPSHLPFVTLQKDRTALISYNKKAPSKPLSALEKLRDAAAVRFEGNGEQNILSLAERLNERASKISRWTKFWDSLGSALFSCFGFKTTAQKVKDVYEAVKNKYKIADDEKNSPKQNDAPLKDEAEEKQKEEAEKRAKDEAAQKAKEEAELNAKLEADRKAKEEAEEKQKEEVEKRAKDEAAQKAKEEAELNAKLEADRKAKEEAEKQAKEEAEKRAKDEAAQKAKEEAELNAKLEADRKAKEEAEVRAKVQAITQKFQGVLIPSALFDIGNNSDKLKIAIQEIENELKGLEEKVKQGVYKYLAELNHYKLAKHFSDLAGLQMEDLSETNGLIKKSIQDNNFQEAQRLIKSVRFVDFKLAWNNSLDAYKQKFEADKKAKDEQERLKQEEAARKRKQTCSDKPDAVERKINAMKGEADVLTYVETLKVPESRDRGYALLLNFTSSYAKANEYANQIADKAIQLEARKKAGLLKKEELDKSHFISQSLYRKLQELESASSFEPSLHLILSIEYARENIQKGEWLTAFESIVNLPFEDIKQSLLDELNKIPLDKKLKSLQKLDVGSYTHDDNKLVFLNQIQEPALQEAAAILLLPAFKKRSEAIKAADMIQNPEKRKQIKFENALLNEQETLAFLQGKPELEKVNLFQKQKDLNNEINRLIDDFFFDEAQTKIQTLRFEEDKGVLNKKCYEAEKKVKTELDDKINEGNIKAAIQILKEQKGKFQAFIVYKFFEKIETPENRLEALQFIRDENLKKDIHKKYTVYTLAEWDAILSQEKGIESELTKGNFDRAREIIKNTNYSDSTKKALLDAIMHRENKVKSKWGLFGY